MAQKGLNKFFEKFLAKEPIFLDKDVLQADYTPESIPHRDEEINKMAGILAPCLRLDKPSNLFIYGKTGTGKTLSIKYISSQLLEVSAQREIPLQILYVNCKLKKVADTEYRLIAQFIKELGKLVPPTGLPTDEVYNIFYSIIDEKKQVLILVLDEIDQLVNKAGDGLLYNLTRMNSGLKNAKVSIIGISNDLTFTNDIDPRVKSSLSEEELVFPPYNAIQLQDILRRRSKKAFKKETVVAGVVEKCAAYAAREHGDARRALELLRVAGELAERNENAKVSISDIDEAEEKIERDRMLDMVKTQPKQFQATLHSILLINSKNKERIFTGEVYEIYKEVCSEVGLRPLTQRRVSDIISELDMMGIVSAKVISKGRYGRTRDISIAIPSHLKSKIRTILKEELGIL